jgi:hypothetical protein
LEGHIAIYYDEKESVEVESHATRRASSVVSARSSRSRVSKATFSSWLVMAC